MKYAVIFDATVGRVHCISFVQGMNLQLQTLQLRVALDGEYWTL